MQRSEFTLFAAVGVLALFVGVQSHRADVAPWRPPHARATAVAAGALAAGDPRGPTGRAGALRLLADRGALDLSPSDVRRRLAAGESGTYMAELLADRDSALARWPARPADRPLRIWIADRPDAAGWGASYPEQVRAAFATWAATGIPVRFSFVADSATADVHVSWVDHFRDPISGKTLWSRDEHWWIVDADITLALHHHDGDPLDASQVRAIALHEIGHLLGLDHTADGGNIMAPRVRVRDLSVADQATVRLLYTVPAGIVRRD